MLAIWPVTPLPEACHCVYVYDYRFSYQLTIRLAPLRDELALCHVLPGVVRQRTGARIVQQRVDVGLTRSPLVLHLIGLHVLTEPVGTVLLLGAHWREGGGGVGITD